MAHVAVAEPAAARPNILVLRHGERRPRTPEIGGVGAEDIQRQLRGDDLPAVRRKSAVLAVERHGELEGLESAAGQIGEVFHSMCLVQ